MTEGQRPELPAIPNDPAGRLHDVLNELRAEPKPDPIGKALAKVLRLDWPDDYPDIALAISAIVRLPAQVKALIGRAPDEDADLLLEHFPAIESALTQLQNLNVPVENLQQGIRDDALYSLRLCSSVIRRTTPERKLKPDDAGRLLKSTYELLDNVVASSLSEATKSLVVEHVSAIERALRLARVEGIKGVEDAFDRTVGALKRRSDVADELITESRDEGTPAHQFWQWMGRLVMLVTVVAGTLQIEGAAKAPGEPPPHVTIDQEQHVTITCDDEPPALPHASQS